METYFLDNGQGKTIKGRAWIAEKAIANAVMMTGMCEHALRYDDFAKFLNSKGISLYVQDAPGQGLNIDEKAGRGIQMWTKNDFDDTVDFAHKKLMEVKLGTGLPTGIMGHSMGSFMTQRFLERHPGDASFVVLVGSNGPALLKYKASYLLACLIVNKRNWDKDSKFIQSAAIGAYERSIKDRKTPNDWVSYNEENLAAYDADPLCGHVNTNGFWKEFLRGMSHLYEKKELAKISKDEKILLVAGDGDPVGEFAKGVLRLERMYKKLGVKDVKCVIYENMRHEILNEKNKQDVYDEILSHILRCIK